MYGESKFVMPSGKENKTGNCGIELLERNLSKGIAERMDAFHYDEICRVDGISMVRAIRSDEGQIDVLGTFMKIRNIRNSQSGGI